MQLPNPVPYNVFRKTDDGLKQITQFGTTQNVVHVTPDDPRTWAWNAVTPQPYTDGEILIEFPEVVPGNYLLKLHILGGPTLIEEFNVSD